MGGAYLLWISILSVIELYFDFSGYVDIATGISQMFGISLSKNFNHPFFSRSAAEFWRRWHITLGEWFKDYVYMPLSTNATLIKISGKIRKKYGMRQAKSFLTIVPLLVVWVITGLWHGTGLNYIVWGLYWGVLIIVSNVFAPEIRKINNKLHIKKDNRAWIVVQVIRTCIVYLIARIISSWSTLGDSFRVFKSILFDFNAVKAIEVLRSMSVEDKFNIIIIFVSVLLTFAVSLYEEKKGSVRKLIARFWCIPRWIVYSLMVLVTLYFGIYGTSDALSGTFAYTHF